MGLFTPRPLCSQAQLAEDELKKDLAGAKAFGAVRLGEKALYLPGIPARRYVPLPWVQRVWLRMMEASVQGEFIQPLLVVAYPGGQVQIEVEHRREVDRLLEALKAQPGLPLGREYPAPEAVTVAQMKELERRADAAGLPYRWPWGSGPPRERRRCCAAGATTAATALWRPAGWPMRALRCAFICWRVSR